MYNLLKKYRQRLLVIATAFLMVSFLLTGTLSSGGGRDPSIGKIDGKKVNLSQLQNADKEWNLLRSRILMPEMSGQSGFRMQPVAAQLGPTAVSQIEEHHDLFLLLKADAFKQGIVISEQRVEDLFRQVQVQSVDMTNPANVDAVKGALQSLLQVSDAYERATSAIRVSEPMRQNELATGYQQIKVSAVDFPAADYLAKVAQPTQEQLQQQFNKYKDVNPEAITTPAANNPFGFGYRYPDRVAFQSLMIPREQVRAAIESSRTSEGWELEARKFYLLNQSRFTSSTQGTDNLTLGPTTRAAALATTRPFRDVQKEALEAVQLPEIDKLQRAIAQRVQSILQSDWTSNKNKQPTSLGASFDSYEYLQKLQQEIQKQYKVTLTVDQFPKLLSARELETAGRISRATTSTRIPFPAYATLNEETHKTLIKQNVPVPPLLQNLQPSQVLEDEMANSFIFRRTAFEASRPASFAEASERVAKDLKTQQAFEMAKQAAADLIKQAQSGNLQAAAASLKKNVVQTGFFRERGIAMGLHLDDKAGEEFTRSAVRDLLSSATTQQSHPMAVVPVYGAARVIAARLDEVKRDWPDESSGRLAVVVERGIEREFGIPLQTQWFNYANVAKRVNYEPERGSTRQEDDSSAPPAGGNPLGI